MVTQYLIATGTPGMSTSGFKCCPHPVGAIRHHLVVVERVEFPAVDVCTVRDLNNHCSVFSIFEQCHFSEHHLVDV